MARCPCHNDSTASLSVKRNGDDVVLHCFAGCDWKALRDALGLTFTPKEKPATALAPTFPSRWIKAEYWYRDYAGDVVAVKRRWEPKTFDWQYLGRDGRMHPKLPDGMTQADLPLYRLREAIAGAELGNPVCIVEGEKDVETLYRLGLFAVCNPEGASGAKSAYDATRFVGLFPPGTTFAILPDNDASGEKHAQRMADALVPTFPDVRIVRLPGLPEKGDVSDWVASQEAAGVQADALGQSLTYAIVHGVPWGEARPVSDAEAVAERAAILEYDAGFPRADAERVASAQVASRLERERATLSPAHRLMLETTDPIMRDIYAAML